MSDRNPCLFVLVALLYAAQALIPAVAYGDGDYNSPQGEKQNTTSLPNGLTVTTRAQVGKDGLLRVSTDVAIPVPGVYESRTDGNQDNQSSSGNAARGLSTRGSISPTTIPGSERTIPFPPCCGNWVVGGGPLSYETGPDGRQNTFGGLAIGGFDFINVAPGMTVAGGQTTPWRTVGPVVQLDPRVLALNVESELGFPPIVLKVNPDPGLAQLESWFWVESYDGDLRTRSGTASETHPECRLNNGNLECRPVTNSITVDVRETPTRYAWDFGDGRTARDGHSASFSTSKGLGRAYTDPYTPSPVQHKYVESSLKFVDAGGFAISLQVSWAAAFRVNGGGWQELDPVTGTFDSRHQVRESWPVGISGATRIGATP